MFLGGAGLAEKTDNPRRSSLLDDSNGACSCSSASWRCRATKNTGALMRAGPLLVALVRQFLQWSGMQFTLKVFEQEMGPAHEEQGTPAQLADALVSKAGHFPYI